LIFRRTQGIVLRRTDYSETSKIVTLYTRDCGKVCVLAKGAKRKKSLFLGILEPLFLLEVVYIEKKKGLHILKEACLIDSNFALREHLWKIAHGLHFLSLIDKTQPEDDPDPAVFDLLVSSLSSLRRLTSPENVPAVLQLQLLRHFGMLPSLSNCARCGSPVKGNASLGARSGGFVCESCGGNKATRVDQGTLKALRRLSETSFERCGRIGLLRKQRVEISRIIRAMWRTAIEADLPAADVVDALLR
jgi:DNA repair protein RecO (recombination protein O)